LGNSEKTTERNFRADSWNNTAGAKSKLRAAAAQFAMTDYAAFPGRDREGAVAGCLIAITKPSTYRADACATITGFLAAGFATVAGCEAG
jgi:hypothetical protein